MKHRILAILAVFCLSSCYMLRAYKVRHFKLTDHQKLPSVPVSAAEQPFLFTEATAASSYSRLQNFLDSNLASSLTAAFLVIKNDSIIYERYFGGFDRSSLLPSFSVAKSFVSTLIAIAVDEGKIKSLQEPVTNYLPELQKRDRRFSKITLQHLLDMRSGIRFNEGGYGLKDDAIKLGFRPNLRKHSLKLMIEKDPGGDFNYQSINTELLALCLEEATGKKISAYLQEKIWQPLGMEYGATWNTDGKKRKQEIAFAGLNATARDFAKIGKLYLDKGSWKGKQILASSWTELPANKDTMDKWDGYKNQWWGNFNYSFIKDSAVSPEYLAALSARFQVTKVSNAYRVASSSGAFHAQGILGQFVYINPANRVIIVRLGRYWSHPKWYAAGFIDAVGRQL
ncbi:MAG TPA: serine hydrolase [Flavisolibacter sp.]|nr:serine hydrolase [Flavisolibacter sp.]